MICRLLESDQDPLFWPALEFYVESFPRDERLPLFVVAGLARGEGLESDSRTRFAVAEIGGQLAGIRIWTYHAIGAIALFIFLAAEPRFRRQGVGRALIDFARDVSLQDAEGMGSRLDAVFFECEVPDLAATPEQHHLRQARIDYFVRQGGVLLSKEHVQPVLGADRQAVPLCLLAYSLVEQPDWKDLIERFYRTVMDLPPGSELERVVTSSL